MLLLCTWGREDVPGAARVCFLLLDMLSSCRSHFDSLHYIYVYAFCRNWGSRGRRTLGIIGF